MIGVVIRYHVRNYLSKLHCQDNSLVGFSVLQCTLHNSTSICVFGQDDHSSYHIVGQGSFLLFAAAFKYFLYNVVSASILLQFLQVWKNFAENGVLVGQAGKIKDFLYLYALLLVLAHGDELPEVLCES